MEGEVRLVIENEDMDAGDFQLMNEDVRLQIELEDEDAIIEEEDDEFDLMIEETYGIDDIDTPRFGYYNEDIQPAMEIFEFIAEYGIENIGALIPVDGIDSLLERVLVALISFTVFHGILIYLLGAVVIASEPPLLMKIITSAVFCILYVLYFRQEQPRSFNLFLLVLFILLSFVSRLM